MGQKEIKCVQTSGRIYARTNDWLGLDPQRLVSLWKDSGFEEKEILQCAFNELYPSSTTSSKEGKTSSATAHEAVLFAVTADQKGLLLNAEGGVLRQRLLSFKNKNVDNFAPLQIKAEARAVYFAWHKKVIELNPYGDSSATGLIETGIPAFNDTVSVTPAFTWRQTNNRLVFLGVLAERIIVKDHKILNPGAIVWDWDDDGLKIARSSKEIFFVVQ